MYSKELEELIDAALADGVLTEKEKQILFKKANPKYLCMALPYGVIVKQGSYKGELRSFDKYTTSLIPLCMIFFAHSLQGNKST